LFIIAGIGLAFRVGDDADASHFTDVRIE